MSLNIVLHEPEIPQNTGNIARTCVVTQSTLHIIKPIGFSMEESQVKRAGLDYWHLLELRLYENYEHFLNENRNAVIYYATTKTRRNYSDVAFQPNAYIMFGKETKGIPEAILAQNPEQCIRIPMLSREEARSLNLANSVAIVTYEALRQWNFPNMI